jgi:hypothetical protein
MADLLTKPRQLAPTVGHNASGARIQARSAFAGIGDTVAIRRVLYDFGFPTVAIELDTEEESSDLELSKLSRSDLKNNPTQPALEVEEWW